MYKITYKLNNRDRKSHIPDYYGANIFSYKWLLADWLLKNSQKLDRYTIERIR